MIKMKDIINKNTLTPFELMLHAFAKKIKKTGKGKHKISSEPRTEFYYFRNRKRSNAAHFKINTHSHTKRKKNQLLYRFVIKL